MSGRHLALAERAAHGLRLGLDHFDQRSRRAGRTARAEFPLAHGADTGADQRGKFALRQAELVPRQASIAVAGNDMMDDGSGLLAARVVERLVKASPNVVGQTIFHALLHVPTVSYLTHFGPSRPLVASRQG